MASIAMQRLLGMLCLGLLLAAAPVACNTSCPGFNETIYLQQALDALDGIVDELLNATGLPGMAVGVIMGNTTLYAKGFGVKEKGSGKLVDADTVFQLASISKTLSATALALAFASPQAAAKNLSWSSRVSKVYPGFKLRTEPANSYTTIADMFAHRSGLPDHAGDLIEDLGFPAQYVYNAMRHYRLGPWRDNYAYTNLGLTVGALGAARMLNITWEQLCQSFLFQPLGMASSSMTFQGFVNSADRATPHIWTEGAKPGPHDPECEGCNGEFNVSPRPNWRDAGVQAPAAAASSSINDMLKWLKFFLAQANTRGTPLQDIYLPQNRRSPRAETAAAHASVLPSMGVGTNGGPSWYGLGLNVGYDLFARASFSHSGAFLLGTGTAFTMVPDYGDGGLAIIALTHGSTIGVAEAVTQSFYDIVNKGSIQPPVGQGAKGWFEVLYPAAFKSFYVVPNTLTGLEPPPAAICQPSRPWEAYVGRYRSAIYGDFVVTYANATGLVGTLGPGDKPLFFNLTCWGGDQFSLQSTGENNVGRSPVNFSGNISRNRPNIVTIFWLNEVNHPDPPLFPFKRLV